MPGHAGQERATDLRQHEKRVATVTGGGTGDWTIHGARTSASRSSCDCDCRARAERSRSSRREAEAEQSNAPATVVPLVADVTKASDCEIVLMRRRSDLAAWIFW